MGEPDSALEHTRARCCAAVSEWGSAYRGKHARPARSRLNNSAEENRPKAHLHNRPCVGQLPNATYDSDMTDLKHHGRAPHRRETLTTATPPSVNHAWVNVAGKGRMRSAKYNVWLRETGWTIRAARILKITGHVAIRIRAGVPDRRRDLDNIVKPLLDALTTFGVIEDDAFCHRLAAEWSLGVKAGLVEIEIRQFSPPETRQRIVRAVSARHAARRTAAQPTQVAA
jgi:Holliday junction resolvase RusA-like endonuclease